MKNLFPLLAIGFLLSLSTSASAALYVPPLEERVPAAELIVTGTITLEKTEDGWHHGHISVTSIIKGETAVGAKIVARWKAPVPRDPALPQLADYTFRPTLDAAQIILLNPKAEGETTYTLNWGNTESPENEAAVKAALGAPPVK